MPERVDGIDRATSLTRRQALAAAMRAAAGWSLAPALVPVLGACAVARRATDSPAPDAPAAPRVVLSLTPWAGALERDAGAVLATARAAGADLVELPSVHPPVGTSPAQLREALDAAGLAVGSARVGTGRLYRGWERTLEAARTLGCGALTCSAPQPDERPTARDWAELGDAMVRASDAASRAGVGFRILIDAAWLTTSSGVDPLGIVLGVTDAAGVALVVNLRGIAEAEGDATAPLRRGGRRVQGVIVDGRPDVDASAVVAARDAGTRDWIVLAPLGALDGRADAARDALGRVRALVARAP